ncbi:MAG TPA: homogentisate phytyltransferase [Phaeodactylibacter sp.]|nr:homogentisate phytyltransferase [Phaeodactylibacter sp.]
MKRVLISFVRFSRPHTIIGTTLSLLALYLLALSYSEDTHWHFGLFAGSLLSCLGANIYIVGLNQLTDIEIDRINKPYLPLASGDFSIRTGKIIIGIGLVLSLILAVWLGPYLLLTVVLSLLLGTAYSLPPFRLKRFYFWAAFCIIAVRGLIVNLLLFLHFHWQINGSTQITPTVAWLTFSIFVFGLIIAWFKDMPDTEGDQAFEIRTLSIKLGVRRVFQTGNVLLSLLFLVLALLPFVVGVQVHPLVFSLGHLGMLGYLWWSISRVDLEQQASIARYYQSIWLLFFLEYGLFALAGLLHG